MGKVCSKQQPAELDRAGSRRLSLTNQPRPEADLPPNTNIDGMVDNGVVVLDFAAVSLPGTYFQPSMNPFKGTTKYKTNQDSFFMDEFVFGEEEKGFQYFGVLDGHGVVGHTASQFLARHLPGILREKRNLIPKRTAQALKETFLEVDEKLMNSEIDVTMSGSTVNTCLLEGDLISCANCGDSRCVLGVLKDDEFEAKDLSIDHKPDLPEEKRRIEASNGRVAPLDSWPDGPHRVWLKVEDIPGLAMSRSLGDRVAHSVGVSSEPEVITHKLNPQTDKFLIMASDGVWEFISSQQAVEMVSMAQTPKEAAELLCKEAVSRWQDEEPVCDDITALVIFIKGRQ